MSVYSILDTILYTFSNQHWTDTDMHWVLYHGTQFISYQSEWLATASNSNILQHAIQSKTLLFTTCNFVAYYKSHIVRLVWKKLYWSYDLLHTPLCVSDITHITAKWPLPTMYALMPLQITLPTEWLITHITAKWPLPTMYLLMCLQVTLITEWLITHVTAKWPLPTMYALMCLQHILPTEWLTAHVTGI
jgi:hypothetical protein